MMINILLNFSCIVYIYNFVDIDKLKEVICFY